MWIEILLLTPLLVSLGCFVSARIGSKSWSMSLHVTGLMLMAFFTLRLGIDVLSQGSVSTEGHWFYVDSLSAIFVIIIGIVGLLAGIYSIGYMNKELALGEFSLLQYSNYYGFFHLFFFTMFLSVMTNNIIVMWVGIEATTLSSAFLVGAYSKRTSLEAAWKYVIICSVGVAFGLYGTLLIFADASNILADPEQAIFWTKINENASALDPALVHLAFIFILIGFGTKCGFFPMHTWLPDAHSEAPSPVSAILSGILLNCAMLIVIRYYIITNKAIGDAFAQTLLLAFGIVSVAIAALFIIAQRDIKRLLAYSSIENMGLIALGFGIGGPLGVFAGLLHTINHSLAKTLLFCASGNILVKYHSRDIGEVRGLWKTMPVTALLFAGGALALSGIPPFNLFISELALVTAGISAGHIGLMLFCLLLLTIVLTALAKMILNTVLGDKPEHIEEGEFSITTLVAMAVLLGLMFLFGLYLSEPMLQLLHNAVNIVLGKNLALADVLPWLPLNN
ncbi:hydrogenase 4 subunit F [Bisgaard Taxon 45]